MGTLVKLIESRISRMAATITAVATVAGMAWAAMDYTGIRPVLKMEFVQLQTQEQQLVIGLALIEYQQLLEKSKHVSLSPEEQQVLCADAGQLGFTAPGCK